MWWFIKKIEEDDTYVTYAYNIFEYAKNHDSDAFRELFCQPLFSTLRKFGFVDSQMIAIG